MLQREEFFMIRDMKSKGMSIAQISRELDIDRKTVSKWLKSDTLPGYSKRSPQPGKLDDYQTYILERMNEGCVNAMVLFDEIRLMGYQGKIL